MTEAERLAEIARIVAPFLSQGHHKGLSPVRALRRIHAFATSPFPAWDSLPGGPTQESSAPRITRNIAAIRELMTGGQEGLR